MIKRLAHKTQLHIVSVPTALPRKALIWSEAEPSTDEGERRGFDSWGVGGWRYSHVASESVQVVVGLLALNYAVVLQRVEITILQTHKQTLIIDG